MATTTKAKTGPKRDLEAEAQDIQDALFNILDRDLEEVVHHCRSTPSWCGGAVDAPDVVRVILGRYPDRRTWQYEMDLQWYPPDASVVVDLAWVRELAKRTGSRPDWSVKGEHTEFRYQTLEAALEALDDALEARAGVWRQRLEQEVG